VIVPPGVLVEADLAPEVARMIAEAVDRDRWRDSEKLKRLRSELGIVAAARPTSGQTVDGDARPWLPIPEASKALLRSERSLRRDAAAGRIEARKERRSWRVRI